MKFHRGDIPLFLFLLLTAVLTVSSFCLVWMLEKPRDSFVSRIPEGKRAFRILASESCVGGIQSEFSQVPGYVFTFRGDVRLRLRGARRTLTFSFGAFFNSLNQLVSANGQIDDSGQTFLFNLSQPNPINVRISVGRQEIGYSVREFKMPGPIEILPNGDGTFRLRFSGFQKNIQRLVSQFAPTKDQSIEKVLQLSLHEVGDGDISTASCDADWDLDPFLNQMQGMLVGSPWFSLLGGGMGGVL